MKLIQRVKIAHSFLQLVSNLFHFIILSLILCRNIYTHVCQKKPTSSLEKLLLFSLAPFVTDFIGKIFHDRDTTLYFGRQFFGKKCEKSVTRLPSRNYRTPIYQAKTCKFLPYRKWPSFFHRCPGVSLLLSLKALQECFHLSNHILKNKETFHAYQISLSTSAFSFNLSENQLRFGTCGMSITTY